MEFILITIAFGTLSILLLALLFDTIEEEPVLKVNEFIYYSPELDAVLLRTTKHNPTPYIVSQVSSSKYYFIGEL